MKKKKRLMLSQDQILGEQTLRHIVAGGDPKHTWNCYCLNPGDVCVETWEYSASISLQDFLEAAAVVATVIMKGGFILPPYINSSTNYTVYQYHQLRRIEGGTKDHINTARGIWAPKLA